MPRKTTEDIKKRNKGSIGADVKDKLLKRRTGTSGRGRGKERDKRRSGKRRVVERRRRLRIQGGNKSGCGSNRVKGRWEDWEDGCLL